MRIPRQTLPFNRVNVRPMRHLLSTIKGKNVSKVMPEGKPEEVFILNERKEISRTDIIF
jgi:hypothetical protein